MLKSFMYLVVIIMHINITLASTNEILNIQCPLTPPIWDDLNFGHTIIKNNNLRRKAGSSYFAEGKFINISGKVLDSDCVPIVDAVIEIWQADSKGNLLGAGDKIDSKFAYSGTAITNNLGEYNFLTIFPGIFNKQAPRIHFKIKHADFLLFESYMYFPNNKSNNFNYELENIIDRNSKNLLVSSCIEADDALEIYNFNITLEGVNKYKRY